MATRTLLEIDVFKHIAEKGSISSQELANVTKADKLLLGKVINAGDFGASADVPQSDFSVYSLLLAMLRN